MKLSGRCRFLWSSRSVVDTKVLAGVFTFSLHQKYGTRPSLVREMVLGVNPFLHVRYKMPDAATSPEQTGFNDATIHSVYGHRVHVAIF